MSDPVLMVCVVCGGSLGSGGVELDRLAEETGAEGLAGEGGVVCGECFGRISAGVCGATRRDYACLRPQGHVPGWQHASMDGRWMVYWSDKSLGVTLRRKAEV